jgi:hypothetical protein
LYGREPVANFSPLVLAGDNVGIEPLQLLDVLVVAITWAINSNRPRAIFRSIKVLPPSQHPR